MLDKAFIPAFNHLLATAPWARQRLMAHAGLTARLELSPFSLHFGIADDGCLVPCTDRAAVDVQLSLPLGSAPLFIAGRIDEAMRQVQLNGNAEFAEALGFVLRNLRWDAEEDLSRVVGDLAAHRLAQGARALAGAQREALTRGAGGMAEFLTEEQALLVSHAALTDMSGELRTLRDELARLEKRIERLAARG